jgi:hypothetical protein
MWTTPGGELIGRVYDTFCTVFGDIFVVAYYVTSSLLLDINITSYCIVLLFFCFYFVSATCIVYIFLVNMFFDQVALCNPHFLTCFIFTRQWTNVGSMKCICMYRLNTCALIDVLTFSSICTFSYLNSCCTFTIHTYHFQDNQRSMQRIPS